MPVRAPILLLYVIIKRFKTKQNNYIIQYMTAVRWEAAIRINIDNLDCVCIMCYYNIMGRLPHYHLTYHWHVPTFDWWYLSIRIFHYCTLYIIIIYVLMVALHEGRWSLGGLRLQCHNILLLLYIILYRINRQSLYFHSQQHIMHYSCYCRLINRSAGVFNLGRWSIF